MRTAILSALLVLSPAAISSVTVGADQSAGVNRAEHVSLPPSRRASPPPRQGGQAQQPPDLGQPRISSITIDGAERTDLQVIADLIALSPGDTLTDSRLARANRRLSELPVASDVQLRYRPGERGSADLSITLEEKSLFPKWWEGWAVVGAEAIFKDDLGVDIAGPLGRAEVWEIGYRWKRERPRLMFGLEMPAGPLPGVFVVDGLWERQTYRLGSTADGALVEERERRIGLGLADWAGPNVRWQAGGAFDQFDDRSFVALQGAVERRLMAERLALMLTAGQWFGFNGEPGFTQADVSANWRSHVPTGRAIPMFTAWIGYTASTADAPLALWPGASTGKGRNAILRAHKLLEQDIVSGEVFGRRLFYATAEYERPVYAHELGTLGVAAFIDTARAWDRIYSDWPSPLHVDVGVGIRLRAPGFGGAIRMDYARGLRDGRSAVSTAWIGTWPRRWYDLLPNTGTPENGSHGWADYNFFLLLCQNAAFSARHPPRFGLSIEQISLGST